MNSKIPVIAIVGRSNVGKSTLFNALAGRRLSIVENVAGVTRDRNYAYVNRHDFPFTLVDTGGLVGEEGSEFENAVRTQANIAIQEADLIIAVLDGLHGTHPLDSEVAEVLRAQSKPIIWVANKCEKPVTAQAAAELYSLGIEDLHCISAAHNLGLRELLGKIKQELGEPVTPDQENNSEQGALKLAIIGKPNVGKSTLLNRFLGVERAITSDTAGTTRDTIKIHVTENDRNFIVFDTAGLRKKARIAPGTLERYSNLRSLRALAECDVAVILIDATTGAPSEQDLKIAALAHERGRGVIVAVNKWDAIEKDHRSVKQYQELIRKSLKFIPYAPIVFVSALSGRRCNQILQKAAEIYDAAANRIATSELNRLLNYAVQKKPAPLYRGEPVKLYFATQVSTHPPEIVLFFNYPDRLNISYQRYLKNIVRKSFPFEGYDIRLRLRKKTDKEERLKQAVG
ncbi:MAG: ribosome biogenesis GTPase Der [Bdellovibrionales bacterium]|nr:ribosome biogenesis GTPase Der [Bdellovibrionales bacterium]